MQQQLKYGHMELSTALKLTSITCTGKHSH